MTDGVVTCSGIEMEMIKAIRLDRMFSYNPIYTLPMQLLYCNSRRSAHCLHCSVTLLAPPIGTPSVPEQKLHLYSVNGVCISVLN